MGKCFRQLQWDDRVRLEQLLKDKSISKRQIAEILGCSTDTVYNEINRGKYEHLNSDYTTEKRYSADLAQRHYEEHLLVRGPGLKIGNDREYAEYIEKKIADEGYSPEAVLGELKAKGLEDKFRTKVCTKTIYNYINKRVFSRLTNRDLPSLKNRKRDYHKIQRLRKRAAPGDDIHKRPDEVGTRETFGHWEMDTVEGKRGSKSCLLVLTERKTRMEIIRKIPSQTGMAVVNAINLLEKRYGDMFPSVFRTITVDNGTEFSFCSQIEQSPYGRGQRTKVYYCDPYSAWQRGSNENENKMIRRKAPKGTSFDERSEEDISGIEGWMNNYPRGIFGYRTALDRFKEEIASVS